MRNLNECRAEVFRRSEKRIKERRQRRKNMLLACIPVVLCAGFFLLPSMLSAVPEDTTPVGGLTNESAECAVAKIEVRGPGVSLSYTQPSDVRLISDRLSAYEEYKYQNNSAANGEIVSESNSEHADGQDGVVIDTTSAGSVYTITLTFQVGGTTEYSLSESGLSNCSTGQIYPLTKDQMKEIKDILRIPSP